MDNADRLQIVALLRGSLSHDPTSLKQAELCLLSLEKDAGFFLHVTQILLDSSMDCDIRCMAIIYIKICIRKYWRKGAANELRNEDKIFIRSSLLSQCTMDIHKMLFSQIAICIAKIVRFETHMQWSELFVTCFNIFENSNTSFEVKNRLSELFYLIFKELSSKKLPSSKLEFYEFSLQNTPLILNYWNQCSQSVILQSNHNNELNEILHYLTKCLKLSIFAIVSQKSPNMEVLSPSIESLIDKFTLLIRLNSSNITVKRILSIIVKILSCCYKTQTPAFTPYFITMLALLVEFFQQPVSFIRKLNSLAASLLEFLLDVFDSCQNSVTSSDQLGETVKYFHQFFTPHTMDTLLQTVVSSLVLFNESDIISILKYPECYYFGEVLNIDTSLRDKAFKFIKCIITTTTDNNNNSTVITTILHLFNQAEQISMRDENSASLLWKEAVYSCMDSAINVNNTITSNLNSAQLYAQLVHELQFEVDTENTVIVKYSILLLLSTLISFTPIPDYIRNSYYETFLLYLDSDKHALLNLAAIDTLRYTVDNLTFDSEQFTPYIGPSLHYIFSLLHKCAELSSKRKLINLIAVLVECCTREILQHISFPLLESLWDSYNDDDSISLRIQLVTLFEALVIKYGKDSHQIINYILKIVSYTCDISDVAHIQLIEDGLSLWAVTLQYSLQLTGELVQLFPLLVQLTEAGPDIDCLTYFTIQHTIGTLRSYILYGCEWFLAQCAAGVVTIIRHFLTKHDTSLVEEACHIINILITVYRNDSNMIVLESLLYIVMDRLFDSEGINQNISTIIAQLTVLSRLLTQSPEYFISLIESYASRTYNEVDTILCCYNELVCNNIEHTVLYEDKLVNSVALISLLRINNNQIVRSFEMLITAIIATFHDSYPDTDEVHEFPYSMVLEYEQYTATYEYTRWNAISQNDIIKQMNVKNYLIESVNMGMSGGDRINQMLLKLDHSILDQFKSILIT